MVGILRTRGWEILVIGSSCINCAMYLEPNEYSGKFWNTVCCLIVRFFENRFVAFLIWAVQKRKDPLAAFNVHFPFPSQIVVSQRWTLASCPRAFSWKRSRWSRTWQHGPVGICFVVSSMMLYVSVVPRFFLGLRKFSWKTSDIRTLVLSK